MTTPIMKLKKVDLWGGLPYIYIYIHTYVHTHTHHTSIPGGINFAQGLIAQL